MILINGQWEVVANLHDVLRIIKEYYNDELAKKMEYLIPEHSDWEYYQLELKYDELRENFDDLEFDYDALQEKMKFSLDDLK